MNRPLLCGFLVALSHIFVATPDAQQASAESTAATNASASVAGDEGAADPASDVAAQPSKAPEPETVAPLSAPLDVTAADTTYDAGNSFDVSWTPLAVEPPGLRYLIERRTAGSSVWEQAGESLIGTSSFVDAPLREGLPVLANGVPYEYRVVAAVGEARAASAPTAAAIAAPSYFDMKRAAVALFVLLFLGVILYCINLARRGKEFYIRPIAGLKALEEAVGRATEMGKPVFFMPGIDEANNIQTLYGMVILQHVTRLVAQYETPLIVAVGKAFVVPLAQETVRQGYLDAGRPELYSPNTVRYFSDEQFATVTAVTGILLREKPATNLYFGSFYAESLILAETGFLTGSIQIAGTGNIHQLPFFVVACDYTLIGEEFFAVSAYLSKDPKLLGGLKAMDYTKVCVVVALFFGFVAATIKPELGAYIASIFSEAPPWVK